MFIRISKYSQCFLLGQMVQKSFSGPRACIIAPKVPMERKKAMTIVITMTNPNVLNIMTYAKSSQTPQPIVVILPLKILTPISL